MFNRIDGDNLKGKLIYSIVDEPWDFTSGIGDNRLAGEIDSVSGPGATIQWIMLLVKPFLLDDVRISKLACISRNRYESDLHRLVAAGQRISVHMYFKFGEGVFSRDFFEKPQPKKGRGAFLLGTIWLASKGWD